MSSLSEQAGISGYCASLEAERPFKTPPILRQLHLNSVCDLQISPQDLIYSYRSLTPCLTTSPSRFAWMFREWMHSLIVRVWLATTSAPQPGCRHGQPGVNRIPFGDEILITKANTRTAPQYET